MYSTNTALIFGGGLTAAFICGISIEAPARAIAGSRISLVDQLNLPVSGYTSSGRTDRPETLPDRVARIRKAEGDRR